MSINVSLSFEIHNIREIHDTGDKSKREEIYKAANDFLENEGILDQDMVVDFLGKEGYLAGYTVRPIIISGFGRWIDDVTKRWEEMAYRILGPSCKPKVSFDTPDED